MIALRRWRGLVVFVVIWLAALYYFFGALPDDTFGLGAVFGSKPSQPEGGEANLPDTAATQNEPVKGIDSHDPNRWHKMADRYPVTSLHVLPTARPLTPIPKIQKQPAPEEDATARRIRFARQADIKQAFLRSWMGYSKHAWMHDEVTPLTAQAKDPFAGWAATLVDGLDTLWIMGLTEYFEDAVKAVDKIDFWTTQSEHINVFETTIRYLGGFMAAYELSGKKYPTLLNKAVEVADLLMGAFDTPNRMPISRWAWKQKIAGDKQRAPAQTIASEPGSLSLEFTKLSQLTGDMRYYDAVQTVMNTFDKHQRSTMLPGMWPLIVNIMKPSFSGSSMFSLGGMSDSLYEYLPKQYLMLGGALEQPQKMYELFIDVAKRHLFRRALNPDNIPIIIPGDVTGNGHTDDQSKISFASRGQHLTCFTGGMVGIASRIFDRPDDLKVAIELTDGCVWSYNATTTGIGPEIFNFVSCGNIDESQTGEGCLWSEQKWRAKVAASRGYDPDSHNEDTITKIIKDGRLARGMTSIDDRKYILRPEAIESVFIMYRITGDPTWMDKAWAMWQAIDKHTNVAVGAASLDDVTLEKPHKVDSMESFWYAETLKYFYLIFSDFDLVDLDTWVLNTEAHPLKRPDVP